MIIDNDGMCTLSDEDMSYHSGNYILPTNADRIRAMSDEELAECIAGDVLNLTGGALAMATEAWLYWLKQEVKT